MKDKTAMLPESFLFLLEQEEKRRQQREDAGLPALTILIDAAHSGGGQASISGDSCLAYITPANGLSS